MRIGAPTKNRPPKKKLDNTKPNDEIIKIILKYFFQTWDAPFLANQNTAGKFSGKSINIEAFQDITSWSVQVAKNKINQENTP